MADDAPPPNVPPETQSDSSTGIHNAESPTQRTATKEGPNMDIETHQTADQADIPNSDATADTAKSASDTGASTDKPAGPAQMLKDGASQLTKEAGNKARTYVEDGKARAGGALDELAKLMTDAAGTVDEKVGAQYGQYARNAADAVSGFSESLKAKNVEDLVTDATDFVKKSPAIAIGTAAALGFVLVRLLQSGLAADTDPASNDRKA